MAKSQKKKTWDRCSRYIRLRDALEYCRLMNIDTGQFARPEDLLVQCFTCLIIRPWSGVDAGHWISRGSGGASGVYFDERNIHAQCKRCNGFMQGNAQIYGDAILAKYGQEVIDELRILNTTNSYKYKLVGLELYYKQAYDELVRTI